MDWKKNDQLIFEIAFNRSIFVWNWMDLFSGLLSYSILFICAVPLINNIFQCKSKYFEERIGRRAAFGGMSGTFPF